MNVVEWRKETKMTVVSASKTLAAASLGLVAGSHADVAVDAVRRVIKSWAFQIDYNLIELKQAIIRGNWNLISEREKANKKNWDLGTFFSLFAGNECCQDDLCQTEC